MFELQRLIATVFPQRRVAGHEVLTGGLINTNLKVHFSGDYKPVVLRLYRHGPAACAKELSIHDLICRDVPVAKIIHAEPNGLDGSPAFAVLEYVEGLTFQRLKRTNDLPSINQAAATVGATLARIGRFQLPDSNGQTKARLVHNDFGNRNIIVREVSGRWRVAAILDWEFATSGSPLVDVGHFLRYERPERPLREPHFSRAYVEHGGVLPENWELLVKLFDFTALAQCLEGPDLPDDVATEVLELISATLHAGDAAA
ncbi:MAG TPA: phosphotransferase [Pyrinomonadaceae bacterium]